MADHIEIRGARVHYLKNQVAQNPASRTSPYRNECLRLENV